MSQRTHHLHLGGPAQVRPMQCHEREAEKNATTHLTPGSRGRYRMLVVYRIEAGYLVLKRGGVAYLGEESFAYFLHPGEDPRAALEPERWRGRQPPTPRESARLDPRSKRDMAAGVFTEESVDRLQRLIEKTRICRAAQGSID